MSKEIMATLTNDYLNELFQKEYMFEQMVEMGKIDLDEAHNELKNEFGEGYNGWAKELE